MTNKRLLEHFCEEFNFKIPIEREAKYAKFLDKMLIKDKKLVVAYTGKAFYGTAIPRPLYFLGLDKLYLYSVLMRDRGVKKDKNSLNEIIVASDDKIPLLALSVPGTWDDEYLHKVQARRETQKRGYPNVSLKTFPGLFDEVAAYKEIVDLWDRKLKYYGDVKFTRDNHETIMSRRKKRSITRGMTNNLMR